MRKILEVLWLSALIAAPVLSVGAAGTACSRHECPLAQAATTAGFEVVQKLPLTTIALGELES
ncbi:MAG: hypothetical protein AB7O52_19015 [Planctomycetota bacterium]